MESSRTKIFARVDALVTQGNTAVVLDRGQTSVTTVGADGRAEQALRAGEGATTMAADPAGRVLVADTRGGELLVFGVDPLILRQRYPVRAAPYGLAGSRRVGLGVSDRGEHCHWLRSVHRNTRRKGALSNCAATELLAFDEAADTLYVVSGSGAGVQVIEHAAVPR